MMEYLAFPDGPGCFRQGSTCLAVLRIPLELLKISSTGFAPSSTDLSISFDYLLKSHLVVLLPRLCVGLGFSNFARHYSRNHSYFLLLQVLRCFNSLGSLLIHYVFMYGYHSITSDGFPHSDIPGSLRAYRSPRRFAVCCVLLLLIMPRHSPYALCNLITLST